MSALAVGPSKPNTIVLNSWKEIAGYLRHGVRTVQRYERDLSLPVRRPGAKDRTALIAMSDEIDAWPPTHHVIRTKSDASPLLEMVPQSIISQDSA